MDLVPLACEDACDQTSPNNYKEKSDLVPYCLQYRPPKIKRKRAPMIIVLNSCMEKG